MKLATVRVDGTTALAAMTDTGVVDLSGSDGLDSVDALCAMLADQRDVLRRLTGTPHGTGAFQHPPRFLADGDVMEAWIERIGSLRNPVQAVTGPGTGQRRSREEVQATVAPTPG
jgi:hypothetical protein